MHIGRSHLLIALILLGKRGMEKVCVCVKSHLKCYLLVWDVGRRGGCGWEQGIYGNSVLPSQFCYEPKTAVEKKYYLTFAKTLMLSVVDSNHIFQKFLFYVSFSYILTSKFVLVQ